MPRPGQVLGLVGTNGIGKLNQTNPLSLFFHPNLLTHSHISIFKTKGKSTALHVLSGQVKPNLGRFDRPPEWSEILAYFRGSELQGYLTRMVEDKLKAITKVQYVDNIPRAIKGKVGDILHQKDERHVFDEMVKNLDLGCVLDREIGDLSGGELQRFAIAVCCVQEADVYMFDEPSSYLDVKQRLKAAEVIRSVCASDKYVVVVEHDLSVLDYLSDFICVLYGEPGAYGVVTTPFGVREGINVFLDGFVPTENLRFREESLKFRLAEHAGETDEIVAASKQQLYQYPAMSKTLGNFKLHVQAGGFTDSEIIVMMGENGTGKTTFIRMLAGLLKPDPDEKGQVPVIPSLNVSYKPQKISPTFTGTVRQLFHTKIKDAFLMPQFQAEVVKPLRIEHVFDQAVQELSGGELQRVAIILALGKPADIYLIDEPSAYLDSEQRIAASKVIKRFIMHSRKTAFIVEHDFIMATYLADRVVQYTGTPAVDATAHTPQALVSGTNSFLRDLDITFRRDPTNFRPRINKRGSTKDREQKEGGTYFLVESTEVE